MSCQYCNAIELTLEKKKIDDLKAQVEELEAQLVSECETTSVLTSDLGLVEAKNKDLKAQVAFQKEVVEVLDDTLRLRSPNERVRSWKQEAEAKVKGRV